MSSEGLAILPVRARPLVRRPELVLVPLLFVILIATWHLTVTFFNVPGYILPKPTEVATAFINGISSGLFLYHGAYTLTEALSGFAIAAISGIVLGSLIAQSRLLEKTLYPYLIVIQTTPKIAIAPLLIIWFGFGISSKIFVAATVAFFPILVNVIAGLRSVDQDKLDLMRALNATKWQRFRMVLLPSALPMIFAGLNVAIVFSILGAIVGEFVGSKAGIGNLILQANTNLDAAGIFAALACLSIMGLLLHGAMAWLQRKVVFWAQDALAPAP